MSIDELQHMALPRLYGAPAYGRPTPVVAHTPRPFDPDDLPIAALQNPDEQDAAGALAGRPYAPEHGDADGDGGGHSLLPRPLRLRTLTRILKGDGDR